MAFLGRVPLPRAVQIQMERKFLEMFRATGDAHALLSDLLTEVEIQMLAKRLAAILMLIDEQSYYRIEQALGVSVSTSKRLHQLLIGGAYPEIERLARNKKQRQKLAEDIGLILRGGLPPRAYVIKKRRS